MTRNIITIGASAGGLETLRELIECLPAGLGASLFVVVHTAPGHPSVLAGILGDMGALTASTARDGELIRPNHIWVAPPDRHLKLTPERIRVVFGPRENRARPSIDPLFRSASQAFGAGVIGIILSGTQDDGCRGLAYIQRHRGITIVQDPADARFSELPRNALRTLDPDFCVPVREMAGLLETLVTQSVAVSKDKSMPEQLESSEFIGVTCPECHGPIFVDRNPGTVEFRCIVGHAYSPEVMRSEHLRNIESALWSAVASLREHATLLRRMAVSAPTYAAMYRTDADLKEQHAAELEQTIERFVHDRAD